ncbi:hypothetical protein GGC03_26910 (plasmid) [Vibrio sp. THAF191c]|nr:hypothetical protein FIU99_27060 [Vibrio sp. THAF64]QGM37999.1 hypothetical protein GGC04_27265 [Vibrio sp. THAF191d]QGN73421.1 hypothetical protein GGC03_26910 [Vibrio sp. THAF191c]
MIITDSDQCKAAFSRLSHAALIDVRDDETCIVNASDLVMILMALTFERGNVSELLNKVRAAGGESS